MGSGSQIAAFFRRKARAERIKAEGAVSERERQLYLELAGLYDQRAEEAEAARG